MTGLVALGCAPAPGWARTDARVCAPSGPARVCLVAQPDRSIRLDLGDADLLPGECADAPARGERGMLRLWLEAGADRPAPLSVHVAPGRVTTVRVRTKGRPRSASARCSLGSD